MGEGLGLDTSKVGMVAAALMEDLASEAAPGEEQEVGTVMLLAEVRGEDEDGTYTFIQFRCNDERTWVQRGLLHAALEQNRELPEDD